MDYVFVKSSKKGMEDFGSVYARHRSGGSNKKYALGFTIKHTEWDKYRSLQFTSSTLMSSIGVRYGQFSQVLAQIKAAFEVTDFDVTKAKSTIESIKNKVLNEMVEMVEVKPKGKILFVDYVKKYYDDLLTGKRLKKQHAVKVSEAYLKGLRIMQTSIKRYEADRNRRLGIDDMTMAWQRDYVKYLQDRGLMPNAINSYMTDIRTVLKGAYEEKLSKIDDFRHSGFVPKKEEVDNIYLTPEHIKALLSVDLSSKDAVIKLINDSGLSDDDKKKERARCRITHVQIMERVRDVFIVGCLTGQRVSDYKRMSLDMVVKINDAEFINITQKKTGKKILIPLDKRVKAILEKYDGVLPTLHPNILNDTIKLIGELIGWTQKVEFDKKHLNPRRGTRFCDMLLSHTARRSFATNAYAAGVPLSSIQAVTGHSSEAQLRRYLKLQVEEKAIQALKDFEGVIDM